MFGSMYFAAWTAQTIKFVEVVPSAIMIYDYVLTLGEEVDCIWNKLQSSKISQWSTLDPVHWDCTHPPIHDHFPLGSGIQCLGTGKTVASFFPVLESWFSCVLIWLVQIILQLRLYAVHHGSKKIVFIGVLGFIVEIIITITCMVEITKFEVSKLLDLTNHIMSYPTAATDIYINYAAITSYECLLFVLAVFAAIRYHREERVPHPVNLNKLKDLRAILISGNIVYFFGTLLYVIAYSAVSLTLPTQWLIAAPRLGPAVTAVFACHLVLHIRSSRASTGLSPQEHESHCLAVFYDHSTRRRR
ncbi:hypothetical protein EDD17DRAFT_551008 [Pisolithus thermaeus]|nr:hypothetical protein EDD17DRAFT_551008 [Pisolithus thermaeus]